MSQDILHAKFYDYLATKLPDRDDLIAAIIERAENDVASFVNSGFGTDITTIYDITDPVIANNLREGITANSVLKAIDKTLDESCYTTVLKWYARFLKSNFNPNNINIGPIPVPGEGENHKEPSPEFNQSELSPGESTHHEGAEILIDNVTHYERNVAARKECIDYYKSIHNGHIICECCGFDFSKAYSEIGEDYIEVHHLFPVSQRGGDYVVNPKVDLVPLCSNCHSMIHRIGGKGDCMSLDDLKRRYIGIHFLDE